jgi:hypothetical protein
MSKLLICSSACFAGPASMYHMHVNSLSKASVRIKVCPLLQARSYTARMQPAVHASFSAECLVRSCFANQYSTIALHRRTCKDLNLHLASLLY